MSDAERQIWRDDGKVPETVLLFNRSWEPGRENDFQRARSLAATFADDLQPVAVVVYGGAGAQVTSRNALATVTPDVLFGSNLAAGLDEARGCRGSDPGRIVVVAYSEPSAHTDEAGETYFTLPAGPDTERYTLSAARECARLGLVVDVHLIGQVRTSLYQSVTELTGGSLTQTG